MSARAKPYAWAIAGILPLAVIAWAAVGIGVALWLLLAAAAWQHIAASLAERAQQAPEAERRARRIRFLEEDLRAAQDLYGTQRRRAAEAIGIRDRKIADLRRELADRDERLLAAETAGVQSLVEDIAFGGVLGGERG